MWRDERAISNILEELIALAVVSVALCLLLTSLSSMVASEVDIQKTLEMKEEARKLLKRIVSHPRLTKDGEYLLLNGAFLRSTSLERFREFLQTSYEFRLVIHDVSNSTDHIFQTSEPVGDVIGATTSCNVWVSPNETHAARMTIIIWRR
ncbi:MAG: hypothetical protein ACE5QW_00990 [Thermoplasmata archaeon]